MIGKQLSFLQSFMYIFVEKKWSFTETSKNPPAVNSLISLGESEVCFYVNSICCILFPFCISGIYPYRAQISGLRLMVLSCMTELSMEVLKITKHPNEGTIKVRWRIKGIPLLRKAVPFIGRRLKASSEGYR